MAELCRALLVLGAHAAYHRADHLLYTRAKPFIESLLQLAADSLEAGVFAFHPAAHVENFQMATLPRLSHKSSATSSTLSPLVVSTRLEAGVVQFGKFAGNITHRKLHERRQVARRAGFCRGRAFPGVPGGKASGRRCIQRSGYPEKPVRPWPSSLSLSRSRAARSRNDGCTCACSASARCRPEVLLSCLLLSLSCSVHADTRVVEQR